MIWFTADWHLGHRGILAHAARPWKDTDEMDFYLTDMLIRTLGPGDRLYLGGDMAWRKPQLEYLLSLCPVETFAILGNHDKPFRKIYEAHCKWVGNLLDTNIEGQSVTISHYAMRVWNKSHYGAWNLYGHSHGSLPPIGMQYDIGIDNNNLNMLNWEMIKHIMAEQAKDERFDLIEEAEKLITAAGPLAWCHHGPVLVEEAYEWEKKAKIWLDKKEQLVKRQR